MVSLCRCCMQTMICLCLCKKHKSLEIDNVPLWSLKPDQVRLLALSQFSSFGVALHKKTVSNGKAF